MARMTFDKAGMLSTLQDGGRYGYQDLGISPSGAMDRQALYCANLLVGNNQEETAVEFTGIGPTVTFESEALIALTGGDFEPRLNGKTIRRYESCSVAPGDVLSMGAAVSGFRGILAVAGGFDITEVLGSGSTDLVTGFGGLKITSGAQLAYQDSGDRLLRKAPELIPVFSEQTIMLRVVLGPDTDRFTPQGLEAFLSQEYEITGESNRMGYRLEGPSIEHVSGAGIISSLVTFGTVQVPGSGKPIVMMAEHQTTGGYARIGHVILSDLGKLAQLKPGQTVSFKQVNVLEATAAHRSEMEKIRRLTSRTFQRFSVSVNGKSYEVDVEVVNEAE